MDQKTLRALVVENRRKGKKFREISELLEKDYGIKRDRQALQGIYKRAVRNMAEGSSRYSITTLADVINFYVLGYNMTEVQEMTNKLGSDITYYIVRDIISTETEYIDDVRNNLVFKTVNLLLKGYTAEQIKEEIAYKYTYPTDKGLRAILSEAYTMIAKNAAVREIAKAYKETEDRELVKEIIQKIGITVSLADIKERV